MAIEISTLSVKVKSDGIKPTADGLNTVAIAGDKAESSVNKLTAAIGKLTAGFVAGGAAAKAYMDAVRLTQQTTGNSGAATAALTLAVTQLNTSIQALTTNLQQNTINQNANREATRRTTNTMNDMHAAARGLSGSLGALWITYGNAAPLIAGAAIGLAFKNVIKQGMEFENTIQSIAVKGQETAESMRELRKTALDLGTGIYGPQAVAGALETLILAGLKAEEAMKGVGAALNLATVGGTSIEKAAYTLVQVGTAMGYTSESFSTVGDVIAKTAAASMSSVESLSEAFKSASSVGVVYGVTLKDLGANLAVLSNLGIQGSAAGTAVKNFYKELDSGSKKVVDTLKTIGVSVERDFKVDGKFKDITTIVATLSDALDKLGDHGGVAIQKITNERGMRSMAALLQAYRKEAGETGNAFADLTQQIEDSAGFTAIGAARQATSAKNQVESTLNTLKRSFIETFDSISPQLSVFSLKLKDTFASDEFKGAVTKVVVMLADFFVLLANNIPTIVAVAEAFLALKIAMLALDAAGVIVKTFTAISVAFEAATGTAVTLRVAALALWASLGPLALVLGAAGAAFAFYKWQKHDALDTTVQDAAVKSNASFAESLEKEATRLEISNKNLRENTSAKEANAKTTRELALAEVAARSAAAVADAQKQYNVAFSKVGSVFSPHAYEDATNAAKFLKATRAQADADMKAAEAGINRVAKLSKENDDLSKKRYDEEQQRNKARTDLAASLAGNPELPGAPDKAANKRQSFLEAERLEMNRLLGVYQERTKAVELSAATELRVMADVEQSRVRANNAAKKYASDSIYQSELALAKRVDEAKFEQQKVNAIAENSNKITEILQREEAYKTSLLGTDSLAIGITEKQTAALMKYNGASEETTKKELARAKAADAVLKVEDSRKKAESYAANLKSDVENLQAQIAETEKYGIVIKANASQMAEAEIAKRKLNETTDAAVIADIRHAAAIKTTLQAMIELQKITVELEKDEESRAAASLANVIGAEQAKVVAINDATNKKIEAYAAGARAAIQIDLASGKITEDAAEKALAKVESARAKALGLSNNKLKIDFDIAGLKDVSTIIDGMADSATAFGDSFSHVGKAIKGVSDVFKKFAKIQEEESKTGKKDQAARVGGYGDMADAAKDFFQEGSVGYKVMSTAAKVAHGIQLAMNIATMASNAATTITGMAAGAAQMFAQAGFGGFAGVAAMGAVMAAFGISLAGSSSKGGTSSEEIQKTQGTGSVFGDSSAKSESIAKSIGLLEEHSSLMLPLTQGMLSALKNIEASMSGLTNLIVRTDGVTSGSNLGIQTGQLNKGAPTDLISKIGTGITQALFGPGLGGVISGFINNLWGKTTQKIVDSGISFGGNVNNLQAGQGFNQYASVDTTKSSWFGLSKNTSNSVQTQGLNKELSSQFGLIFTNLEDALKFAAPGLGKSAEEVGKTIGSTLIAETKISLKDLKGDDLTKAVNAMLSKAMDQIAEAAFPGLDAFRQVGEGYAQTVIRVATGVEQAGYALDKLGISAIDYTQIANKQGDVGTEIARQSILAVEGLNGVGLMMQSLTGTVTELTDTYKELVLIRLQLKNTGINPTGLSSAMVQGAGGVSELSGGLKSFQENYFTEAEKAAAKTSEVAAQFRVLGIDMPKNKDALKALIQNTGTSTDASAKLTGALLALTGAFSDAQESSLALVDTAKNNVATAFKTASDALQTSIDKLKAFQKTLLDFVGSLRTGSLSTLTPMQKLAETQATYEDMLKKAKGGDEVAKAGITAAAQAYLEASRIVNASSDAYTQANLTVQAELSNLAAIAGEQQTAAQMQLDALNQQVKGLIDLNTTALSIQEAIKQLGDAMIKAGLTTRSEFDSLHGSHAGGLDRVPFDNYRAELHEGEGVLDAQAMSVMKRYFGGSPVISSGTSSEDLGALRQEVASLKGTIQDMGVMVAGAVMQSGNNNAKEVSGSVKEAADKQIYASRSTVTVGGR